MVECRHKTILGRKTDPAPSWRRPVFEIKSAFFAAVVFKLLQGSQGHFMEKRTLSNNRVLVADDESSVREALKILLGVDRYVVTEAIDGKDALALFSKESYDLVIIDYAMPGMGGEELAENIRRLAPTQPIIMATGQVESLTGRNLAADLILVKPFALSELRDCIAKVLAIRA
jgi:CheY-like chemotaxis protein